MKRTHIMLHFFLLVFLSPCATCSELPSRHRRSWIIDSFSIEEGHPGPFPYELGKVNIEREYRVYFDLYGEGVDEEPKGVLSIQKESGTVLVHRAVDYEEKTQLMLKFEARKTDLSLDTKLGVEISILDINDNPPRFQRDQYEITVDEDTEQGSNLLTLLAFDRDQRGTPNSTFHYEIRSVSPNPPDTEFTIDESGGISFRGCLDHEVAEMFTVVVEAKDHGDVVSLSSSTTVIIHIQDGNNNQPTISGQTGSGKVKEGETGVSPLRLHVTDKDTPNSPAWRVKYTIQGDEGEHFTTETDPDTNDGILTVIKPLDFEQEAQKELTISVENHAPYFSCKVKDRTPSGLWRVDTSKGGDEHQPHSVKVIIEVEDANDPPQFSVKVKEAMLEENTPAGTWVEKVTAVDPDSSHARDFVYQVGEDPAGWLTVDPQTGDITTIQSPDRESPHVVDGVYTVLLHAVDNGKPPLTGTSTLNVHVIDQNDNVPHPAVDSVGVCVSDGLSTTSTSITAFDLDQNPFGGPFTFELLGDTDRKWKLDPSQGFTAGLVKEPGVFPGRHMIKLKISDMQGVFGVYNLSVTVCDCSVMPNCSSLQQTAIKAASGAVGAVLASLLLLLLLPLMAVVVTCRKEFITLQATDSSGETILASNIEKPGTDCKLPDRDLAVSSEKMLHDPSHWKRLHDGKHYSSTLKVAEQNFSFRDHRRENIYHLFNENWEQTTWNTLILDGYHRTQQIEDMRTRDFLYKMNQSYATEAALLALLHERLSALQETEGDLLDDQLHLYADEGESDNQSELDSITIPDEDTVQKVLKDLSPRFKQLASICKPMHKN